MATRKTTTAKAKQPTRAKPAEAKAEPVAETTAEASAPETNQEASATSTDAASQQPTPEATDAAAEQVPGTQTPADAGASTAAPQPTEIQGDTVTGDGSGNALPPTQELPGVFVRTKRRVKSRRRAGFRFNREGVGISLELLSEQQLKQLREDPALEVTDCTFPVDDATTTPEA